MKFILKKINQNKSGVSEIIAYVLLIAIVLFLSIGIYAWLKVASNVTPAVDCNEGTSVIVADYQCLGDIRLNIKNNGLFNVDGIILAVGNDSKKSPEIYPLSSHLDNSLEGYYNFIPALEPGQTQEAKFIAETNTGEFPFTNISVIQIQPFIIDKNQIIICNKAVIKQNIENCNLD